MGEVDFSGRLKNRLTDKRDIRMHECRLYMAMGSPWSRVVWSAGHWIRAQFGFRCVPTPTTARERGRMTTP